MEKFLENTIEVQISTQPYLKRMPLSGGNFSTYVIAYFRCVFYFLLKIFYIYVPKMTGYGCIAWNGRWACRNILNFFIAQTFLTKTSLNIHSHCSIGAVIIFTSKETVWRFITITSPPFFFFRIFPRCLNKYRYMYWYEYLCMYI